MVESPSSCGSDDLDAERLRHLEAVHPALSVEVSGSEALTGRTSTKGRPLA